MPRAERAADGRSDDGAIDVLVVVPPRSLLLDVAGPAEALRLANARLAASGRGELFRLRYVGPQSQAVSSVGPCLAGLEPLPRSLEGPTWVLLVGQPGRLLEAPDAATRATVAWLTETVGPALTSGPRSRLVTVCAGTLLAARADLLGTARCTAHHDHLGELRRLAPRAQVVDNRVLVVDGQLASSAGVTAGVDLTLHLVAETCGDPVAAAVAQTMVVYLRRTSADPELSPLLAHRAHLTPALHRGCRTRCAPAPRRPGRSTPWRRPGTSPVGTCSGSSPGTPRSPRGPTSSRSVWRGPDRRWPTERPSPEPRKKPGSRPTCSCAVPGADTWAAPRQARRSA